MTPPSADQVTQLLARWRDGDPAALNTLIPLVEADLRRLARAFMRRERAEHTLQTTALVNEAYIRLVDQRSASWQNRAHFFAVAATIMRRVLVDHAKTRLRGKRGGAAIKIPLDEAKTLAEERSVELVTLDEALNRLAEVDTRKIKVVEMRFFGGMSVGEIAEVLGISPNTVMRDWNLAKAWLQREMAGIADGDES